MVYAKFRAVFIAFFFLIASTFLIDHSTAVRVRCGECGRILHVTRTLRLGDPLPEHDCTPPVTEQPRPESPRNLRVYLLNIKNDPNNFLLMLSATVPMLHIHGKPRRRQMIQNGVVDGMKHQQQLFLIFSLDNARPFFPPATWLQFASDDGDKSFFSILHIFLANLT